MFERDRNGDIARGLIVGILIATAFFVLMGLLPNSAQEAVGGVSNNPNQTANHSNQCSNRNEPVWGPWFGLCFVLADTLAQWIMMAFTVVAAGLLYGTLRQANRTNEAAIRASEAAIESNRIAREFGIKQNRCYLTFEHSISAFEGIASDIAPMQTLRLELRNNGNTPADISNITVYIEALSAITYETDPYNEGIEYVRSAEFQNAFIDRDGNRVIPGSSHHTSISLGKELIDECLAENKGILVGIVATYEDDFENVYETRAAIAIKVELNADRSRVLFETRGHRLQSERQLKQAPTS